MYQVIVLKGGEPLHNIPCDAFVLGTVSAKADSCLTKSAGPIAFCTFATFALLADVQATLRDHLGNPAGMPPD